jgi:hypothetical protein
MALYSAIGVDFKAGLMKEFESLVDERIRTVINQTLKQVCHDYDLDYKSLKARYCSKASLVEYETPASKTVTVDLEETQVVHHAEAPSEPASPKPKSKGKAPKAKVPEKALPALSKMKKAELVEECEVRGLDSEGTVAQLRERLKESRDGVSEKKKAPSKAKEVKEKKAPKEKKKLPPPPPPPVEALEEEGDEDEDAEDDEVSKDVCQRVPVDDEEFEEEDDDEDLQSRLRKILADAGEEEEDFEDDD